jgi:hypothetical protein
MSNDLQIIKTVSTEHILGDQHYFVAMKPVDTWTQKEITYNGQRYELISTQDGAIYCSKIFATISNVFSSMHDNVVFAIAEIHPRKTRIFIMADE